MAVYSYTTSTTSPQISEYSSSAISVFASYVVSEFGTKGNNLFKIFSSSNQLEEAASYSFNPSSYSIFEAEDYGFISEIILESEDYGIVSERHSEFISYGLITSTDSLLPYGTIKVRKSSALTQFNLRIIGGVEFHLQGGSLEAFGSPYIGYDLSTLSGRGLESISPATHISSGNIFSFQSGAESNTESYLQRTELFKLSGGSSEKNTESYVGSGTFSTLISFTESIGSNPPENTALFKFTGSGIEKNTESYVGSGTLSIKGILTEKNTESYVGSGYSRFVGYIVEKNTENYVGFGSLFGLSSATESFGPNPPENIALFRISGSVIEKNTESYVGSGTLSIKGILTEKNTESYVGSGYSRFVGAATESTTPATEIGSGSLFAFSSATESFGPNPPENTALFRISGVAIESNTESYVGFGSLFAITNFKESVTYSYNESAQVSYITFDRGFISSLPTDQDEDYGLISEPDVFVENEDFGRITFDIDVPVYGSIFIKGISIPNFRLRHIGSGSLFGFSSATESFGPNPPENIQLLNIFGNAIEKNTENYLSSGGGFKLSSTLVNLIFIIAVSGSGFINIEGSIVEKNTEAYLGSGSLFSFSSTTQAFGPNPPENTALFKFSGSAAESTTPATEIGSGKLFEIGTKEERRTYSYNQSADSEFINEDYGDFTPYAEQDDYGFIIDLPTTRPNEDYGLITSNVKRSFGLFSINGSSIVSNTESYVGYESITISGTAISPLALKLPPFFVEARFSGSLVEKNTESYVGSGSLFAFGSRTESTLVVPPVSGLFRISGFVVEKNTESYFGSGSLFAFSSATESFGPNPPENTALFRISGAGIESNTENYVGSGSLFAFGSSTESSILTSVSSGLFRISGSVIESNTENYVGFGSLFSFGSKTESFGPNPPENTALFKFTGVAIESNTESYVGSGSLFAFGSRTESTLVAPPVSGLFRISGSGIEKNTESYVGSGSLFAFSSATESFGPNPPENTALFRISGAATESTTPATEIGSGSLFAFSSATESFGPNPPENTALFKITGSVVEKNTESYVGFGSLFAFSSTTESRLVSPPVSGLFRISGAAAESTTPATEIGSGILKISQKVVNLDAKNKARLVGAFESRTSIPKIDGCDLKFYGSVFLYFEYRETGVGQLTVTGSAQIQTNPVHVGSGKIQTGANAYPVSFALSEKGFGSLFSFGSKTESFGPNPPENTALFRISGAATDIKNTEAYLGSGSEFVRGNALSIFKLRHIGSGFTRFSDSAQEKNTESYVGSGSLFAFSSATESFGPNPPENTALFKFTGAATDIKNTEAYLGSGSLFTFVSKTESVSFSPEGAKVLFNIFGIAQEKNTESYVGSGVFSGFSSATESFGPNPPENTALFKFTGAATDIKNTEAYLGSGSLFTFVSKTESVSFSQESKVLFNFFGSSDEKNTESYVGSGLFSGFSSAIESFGPNPPENIALFRISGAATGIKNTETYLGSGSLFGFSSAVEVFAANPLENTALFRISGSVIESNTESYVGFGSLFGLSSATESFGPNPPENIALFRISGSAQEKSIKGEYLGSGSLFTFVSKTESVSFSQEFKVLFKFSGSSDEKNTEAYLGSGVFSGFSSATESFGPNPPENTALFRISGAATESTTPATEIGSGSLFTFVSKTESVSFSQEFKVLFKFSGAATDIKNTEAYLGSGSIFSISGASESFISRYKIEQRLFRILGTKNESFAKGLYTGNLEAFISGLSSNIKIDYIHPKPSRIYII